MARGRQPGVVYRQPVVDFGSFRGYLSTRRRYSGEAIALRLLLLLDVPPEVTDAPELLAWLAANPQPDGIVAHVREARGAYCDALRAARRRQRAAIKAGAD
jgi:hypothetical protein